MALSDTILEDRVTAALVLAEQERLGRQLHDTLGPQIAAISRLAESLHERLQTKGAEETALAFKLLDRVERAQVDARLLARGLMPVEVDADPSEIVLQLCDDGNQLSLQVRDDGATPSDGLSEVEGNGIRIMRHRCQLIGAVLEIDSGANGGVVVTCTIKHEEKQNG